MGSTESIPIARTDDPYNTTNLYYDGGLPVIASNNMKSPGSFSHEGNNFHDGSPQPRSRSVNEQKRTSPHEKPIARDADADRATPLKECHSRSQVISSAESYSDESSNVADVAELPADESKHEKSKFRMVQKPAKRSIEINDILNDVKDFKFIFDISTQDGATSCSSRKTVDNSSLKLSNNDSKRKQRADQMHYGVLPSLSRSNHMPLKQNSPERSKRESRPSSKKQEAEATSQVGTASKSRVHQKKLGASKSNKNKTKNVLHHVLFRSDNSMVSANISRHNCSDNDSKGSNKGHAESEDVNLARNAIQDADLVNISSKTKKLRKGHAIHHAQFHTNTFVSSVLDSRHQLSDNDAEHGDNLHTELEKVGPPRTVEQNLDLVVSPHPHDILLGRGNGVAQFPGNKVFRRFCWEAREAYHKAVRNEKGKVAEAVIHLVRNQNPPGRFLERRDDGLYTDVPHERCKEKICQALREKKWAPTGKDEPCNESDGEESKPIKANKRPLSAITLDNELKNSPKVPDHDFSKSRKSVNRVAHVQIPPSTEMPSSSLPSKLPTQIKQFDGSETADEIRNVGEGSRVSVYWPLDDIYYNATILQQIRNVSFLKYDDNETEWLDLSKHKFKILSSQSSSTCTSGNISKSIKQKKSKCVSKI